MEDPDRLRRVRLNALHHASHQAWDAVVERFESYLQEACRLTLSRKTTRLGPVGGSSVHK